jgi:hypothetical protein
MLSNAFDQVAGERRQIVGAQAALDQLVADRGISARIEIVLVQNLERDFPCSTATCHGMNAEG